jgi:hypothetical protein
VVAQNPAEREGSEPPGFSVDTYQKIKYLHEAIKLKILLVSEITSTSNNDIKIINFS